MSLSSTIYFCYIIYNNLYQLKMCHILAYSLLTQSLQCKLSEHREFFSHFPFPPPGGLPDPGKETTSLVSPALAGGFFTTAPPGKPIWAQEGPLIAQKSELHNTGDTSLETAIGGAAYGDPVSSHHRTPLPGFLEHTSTHFEHLLCARLRAKNRAWSRLTTIIICFVQMRKSLLRKIKYQIQAHWPRAVEPGFNPNLTPGISQG